MNEKLKKIASVASLSGSAIVPDFMKRKSSSRNITPPSNTALDADAYTTPPHLIKEGTERPSPEDELLTTPTAAQSGPSGPPPGQKDILTIDKYGFNRSITGADLSRPIFDGTSAVLSDHLIDVDSDAMETALDVRVYFWMIGERLREFAEDSKTHTVEEARVYDEAVVKEGREYVKACRERGAGYFLNRDRETQLRWYSRFGNPWYRMPALGIIAEMYNGPLEAREGEGYLYESLDDSEEDPRMEGIMITNVRLPLWMADFESDSFRQGTADWNTHIMGMYTTVNPILDIKYGGNTGREQAISTLFAFCEDYTTPAGRDAMIERLWPNEVPAPPGPPIKLLPLNGSNTTAADFLNLSFRRPETESDQGFRKKLSQTFWGGRKG